MSQRSFYDEWETYLREGMIAFVQAHADRTEPIEWLSGLEPGFSRMMGDDDDPTACFALYPSRADFGLPLVAPGRTDDDVTELQQWLDALKSDLAAGRQPDHDFSAALPLLRQLLAWSASQAVGGPDAASVQDGLATLATIPRNADDPVGELERLLREVVSTHANRLDAWYTGIAAERLEDKRRAKPDGVLVGAYGWLEDVQPRPGGASQGYVLAPSPAHAVTAAILRSGWSGFGGDAESAGLAVDLSSDRIRRARWLTDGVRNGQDLAALLGARLERRMQDAGIPGQIEDLRKAALRAAGSTAPPTAIVDGLLVARGRAYQQAPADERDGYSAAEVAAADELEGLVANAELTADRAHASERRAGRRSRRPRRDRRRGRRPERVLARGGQRAGGDDHADRGVDRRARLPAASLRRRAQVRDHDHPPAAPARRPGCGGCLERGGGQRAGARRAGARGVARGCARGARPGSGSSSVSGIPTRARRLRRRSSARSRTSGSPRST